MVIHCLFKWLPIVYFNGYPLFGLVVTHCLCQWLPIVCFRTNGYPLFVLELKKKDREREIQEKKIQELQEARLKQEQESVKNTGMY